MIETSEQRQILDMLKDGRIDTEDAERLLERLGEADAPGAGAPRPPVPPGEQHLSVVIRTQDGDEIDARVPLKLIATGMAFEKLLPETARGAVEDIGIDLAELRNVRGDQLIETIQNLEVDLEDHDGNSISIRCE